MAHSTSVATVCISVAIGGVAVLAVQRLWAASSAKATNRLSKARRTSLSTSSSSCHPSASGSSSLVKAGATSSNIPVLSGKAPNQSATSATAQFRSLIKTEQERDRAQEKLGSMKLKVEQLQRQVNKLSELKGQPLILPPSPTKDFDCDNLDRGCNLNCSDSSCTDCFQDALRPNANKRADPTDPSPREVYLSWDDYFMSLAFLSALRSKDPNKQVGAVITGPDRVILGIGYNGFPRGCSDHALSWAKKSDDGSPLGTKYPYVCHAEMNAIMNKNAVSLKGASIYVTMFPCNNCAKLLIQAGIKEVIYFEDKRAVRQGCVNDNTIDTPTKGGVRPDPAYEASQRLLSHAGIRLRQHKPERPIFLDF